MRIVEGRRYRNFHHLLDLDAFEEAIGFDATTEKDNKNGEAMDLGHCPDPWQLHKNGDTTGKFAINRERGTYNCFVCGHGNLLDLAMAINDMEEQEAEDWLYQFTAPSETSDDDFLAEIEAILSTKNIAKPVMPFYNEHVLDKWTINLPHLDSWLRERGISEDIAVKAHVGFQKTAMRMKDPRNSEERYFGPAVCFPHFWGERLVGWQQRWLDEDRPKWVAKYTNTSAFPKEDTIYNLENVYLAQKPVIVCESVPTVLLLWSLGYPAVATFGGSVTAEQMRLLRCFQQGVVLAPDNDAPGRKWTSHTPEEIQRRKTHTRVLFGDYLAAFLPVKVMEPVGAYDSGNDLGDLLDEGLRFAAEAVRVLYEDAEYY